MPPLEGNKIKTDPDSENPGPEPRKLTCPDSGRLRWHLEAFW